MTLPKKHNQLFLLFMSIVVIIFSLIILFFISKSRSFQFFGTIINRVNTSQKLIALTFDDAPTASTLEVLSILKKYNIKATFYVIGQAANDLPDILKKIVDDGHEIGNHSYSHPRFYFKSQSFINSEIQSTNQLIRHSGYKDNITFRPPYGKKLFSLPWYLWRHNTTSIMCDVEADTYINQKLSNETEDEFIARFTINHTKPGSIILLHPLCLSCQNDRLALEKIIPALQSQGYTFVTVSELLKTE